MSFGGRWMTVVATPVAVRVSAVVLGVVALAAQGSSASATNPRPGDPAADAAPVPHPLPYSSLLSEETRSRLQHTEDSWKPIRKELKACGHPSKDDPSGIAAIRNCQANLFAGSEIYREIRQRYAVTIDGEVIGGVATEIFTPVGGVSPQNKERVLINLHGGGFESAHFINRFESIPIAAVARIKVISVDYRQAPQYSFPAASEDVAAVYTALIKQYEPRNIGIFGCSAGGLLTAQSIAWFQKQNLPLPGAVGMFCAGASYFQEGDSAKFPLLWKDRSELPRDDFILPYLQNVDSNDALAYPVRSRSIMAKFPPSLLITSTRDFTLSSVVHTHSVLVQEGVPAELYVWEGLAHGFFTDPGLPQSREMYEITARFFARYLGRSN
jgi:epsilon-lactone hydrolase